MKKIVLVSLLVIVIVCAFIFVPRIYNDYKEKKVSTKLEELKLEADQLTAKGKYLEAAEVIKEMTALMKGEKYTRDTNPEETFELKGEITTKSLFEELEFTDIKVVWSKVVSTGDLTGKIKNNSSVNIEGYFGIYFFDKNGDVTYIRDSIPIPGDGVGAGEEILFSVPVNKFEYSSYKIQGDILREVK